MTVSDYPPCARLCLCTTVWQVISAARRVFTPADSGVPACYSASPRSEMNCSVSSSTLPYASNITGVRRSLSACIVADFPRTLGTERSHILLNAGGALAGLGESDLHGQLNRSHLEPDPALLAVPQGGG